MRYGVPRYRLLSAITPLRYGYLQTAPLILRRHVRIGGPCRGSTRRRSQTIGRRRLSPLEVYRPRLRPQSAPVRLVLVAAFKKIKNKFHKI